MSSNAIDNVGTITNFTHTDVVEAISTLNISKPQKILSNNIRDSLNIDNIESKSKESDIELVSEASSSQRSKISLKSGSETAGKSGNKQNSTRVSLKRGKELYLP